MASADTVRECLYRPGANGRELIDLIHQASASLVYGVTPSSLKSVELQRLTDGMIIGASEVVGKEGAAYRVSDALREICGALSGLSAGPIRAGIDFGLETGIGAGQCDKIVSIGDQALFVRCRGWGGTGVT